MHVVKTELDFPTMETVNIDGKFTFVEMANVPVDVLYEQLTRSAVLERRRRQILYPRVTTPLAKGTVNGG